MVSLPLCKKFSERFLQIGAFSSSLRRELSFGESGGMQEMGVFSCTAYDFSWTIRNSPSLLTLPGQWTLHLGPPYSSLTALAVSSSPGYIACSETFKECSCRRIGSLRS